MNGPLVKREHGDLQNRYERARHSQGSPNIRRAKTGDIKAIMRLYHTTADEDGYFSYWGSDLKRYIKSDKCIVLVGTVDKKVVAYALVYDHENWGYVDTLIVDPDYRRLKVGTKLLDAIWSFAPKQWVVIELCHEITDISLIKFLTEIGYKTFKPPLNLSWRYKARP